MFCRVIITILLFYTASQISFASEQINGAWYPDKVQRNIDKIKPDKKIEILNVCKNSNSSKDVLIYSTKKTIDIYTKCRIIGTGGYNTYLRNQSDEIASKLCVKYNSKAVYRGKAKHTKSLFKGALDLSLGNIQVVGNSYICETLPIVKKNPPAKNPKPLKVPINESDNNLSSIFIICLFGFFIFLILMFVNSKFTESKTKDLGKNKKKLDPSRPITSFEERFNQFSISNKNVSDDLSIKPEVKFSNKTKIVKATILPPVKNIKKRATFFTNTSSSNNFYEILPALLIVFVLLIGGYNYISGTIQNNQNKKIEVQIAKQKAVNQMILKMAQNKKDHENRMKFLDEQSDKLRKEYNDEIAYQKQKKALMNLGQTLTNYGQKTLNNSKSSKAKSYSPDVKNDFSYRGARCVNTYSSTFACNNNGVVSYFTLRSDGYVSLPDGSAVKLSSKLGSFKVNNSTCNFKVTPSYNYTSYEPKYINRGNFQFICN